MKPKRPPMNPTLVCPRCLATCSEPAPGIARCRSCLWNGPIAQALEGTAMANTILTISDVSFAAATPSDRETGLLGFVAATLNGRLRIDGLTLRRALTGRIYVGFPNRHDAAGRTLLMIRPLDTETQRSLERQILEALAIDNEVSK